ncbi:hypothetical protein CAP36_01860 [Chitinophagaceae bacterium IBVUCB2]|nr:hypothetical protein CAP36_01860 [Chitinophagaceae bacterium IBVUCB2]
MKLFYKLTLTVISVLLISFSASAQNRFFTDAGQNQTLSTTGQRVIVPEKFRTSGLDVQQMKTFLWSLPSEASLLSNRNQAPVLELPMPNGTMAKFRVWESSIQEPGLAVKFPEIRTFAGQGIDDPYATIRFDYNPYFGFSAQINSPNGRIIIDPYARRDVNNYVSYYMRDYKGRTEFSCSTENIPVNQNVVPDAGPCRGTQLRTYRLAFAITGEFAQAVGGGLAGPTHAALVTGVNRLTQVYEDELAIRLVLIADNNLIEYLNPATDPWANNGSIAELNAITGIINTALAGVGGSSAYDIGHLGCTASNAGVAGLGVVCSGSKGRGLTGGVNPVGDPYYIDYVAHEMGHQFNAPHSFNSNTCASPGGSYEPGSGTTIMAYAGICSATENIQPNSDAIFHAISYDAIINFITSGGGAGCGTVSATGNTLPVITSIGTNNVSIPINTPFTLTGAATDADGDAITYNWEGWDVGAAGSWPSAATSTTRPLFRTRVSKTSGSRTFPDIRVIAANYPGTGAPSVLDGLRGEVLPQVARAMKFRLTVRDNRAGGGGVVSSGEGCQDATTFQVNAVGSTPFAVTTPNGGEVYDAGTSQTITWNNAGTTAAPFNVANVRITLSVDGGLTYPHELTASTANDGSESLNLPVIPATTSARIRIEALGNIFFDISNTNFTINAATSGFTFNSPAPVVSACPAPGPMQTTLTATYVGGFNTNITLTSSVTPTTPVVPAIAFGTNPLTTGSTSTTVSITNAAALSAGTYTVTVTGTAGAVVQTRAITFTINPGAGPAITTPPSNQTVCAGDNTSFTVVSPTATSYQWQVSTLAVPTFTNIGGATTATLNLPGVTAGMSGNQYRVIASTQCGSTTSAAATLTVNTAPAVTANPQNITLCAGGNHTFSVGATGSGLTYQWQISTAAVPAFTDIPTATASSYTVNGITAAMNGNQYRVVVSGSCPSPATSAAATLTVISPVTVTGQPANTTVCDGANASFTVAGSGTGVIYQWQVNTGAGFVNVPAGAPYSGANTATLNITGVTPSMSGYQYRAQLSNATCTTPGVSNAATLTVNTLPAISASPTSATICVGGNNTFSATASGTGIGYQWQISTAAVPAFTDIPTATASTYTVTGATAGMNGNQYRVVVTGTCAPAATSAAATLTVITPVAVATQPAAAIEICSGSNTSLSVTGTSTQPITYQWQVNTGAGFNNVTNGNGIAGANSATLTFTNSTVAMSGTYRVQLSNTTCTAPTTSANSVLIVRQLPTVGLTASLSSLLPGQTSLLTATPSAQTAGTLTTTWLYNGTAVANTGNTRTVNVEQVGTYRVTIQEVFSGVTCSNQSPEVVINATVSNKLFIFPTPNNGNFTVSYYNNGGSNTSRTIIVYDSKGNKAYSKQFPITGAYTLIPINMSNAARGIYFVVVGDAAGRRLAEGKVQIMR